MSRTPYHKETGAMLGEIVDESEAGIIKIKNRFDRIVAFNSEEIIFDSAAAEKIALHYKAKKKKEKIKYKPVNNDIPLWISNFTGFFQITEGVIIIFFILMSTANYLNYELFGFAAGMLIFLGINLLRLEYWAWIGSVIINVLQLLAAALFIYERFHLMDINLRYVMLLLWPAILLRFLFRARDNFRS